MIHPLFVLHQQYLDMLENNDNRFIPIIFEDFITCCKNYKPNDRFGKWIDYINNRYIISDL